MGTTDGLRQLRVYCPKHNLTFGASAQREILCEIDGAPLSHDFPYGELWEYCCLCQTYWPSNLTHGTKLTDQCPRCDREITKRFYCDQCQTLIHDSDESSRGKLFWINERGAIEPACPSCQGVVPNSLPNAHHCEEVAAIFTTPREVCPLCQERVVKPVKKTVQSASQIEPLAPVSVGDFVRQVPYKAQIAKMDYSKGALVEDSSGSGPFLIIPCGQSTDYSYLIPRYEKLEAKLDFATYYAKFYECKHAGSGDIFIIKPTIVTPTNGGWLLLEKGELKVGRDSSPDHRSGRIFNCPYCGAKGDASQSFCGECGKEVDTASLKTDTGRLPEISANSLSSIAACPNCRRPTRPGNEFCGDCGYDLRPPIRSQETKETGAQAQSHKSKVKKTLVGLSVIIGIAIIFGILLSGRKSGSPYNSSTNNYTSEPASTPNPIGRTGKLTTNVNMRTCADKTCQLIAEHFQGATLKVLDIRTKESGSDWYKVQITSYGCHAQNSNWCGKKLPRDKEDRDRSYEMEGDNAAADIGWIISEINGGYIINFN